MPRTAPAGAAAALQQRGGFMPTILLDVELADNATRFYWADVGGQYPARLGGGNQQYLPYVKSFGPYKFSRSLRTDSGDLKIQNLSGNLIGRDVAAALAANEFDGAMCVVRYWNQFLSASLFEIHGKLTEPVPAEEEVASRMVQLFDPNQQSLPKDGFSATCSLRYLSAQCGSVSALPTCDFIVSSCQTRVAIERFNGMPFSVPPKAGPRREPRENIHLDRYRRGIQF